MLDYLDSVITRVGQWGYLVIFFAATLESAAFLGLLFHMADIHTCRELRAARPHRQPELERRTK
jgi:hypothetical protein